MQKSTEMAFSRTVVLLLTNFPKTECPFCPATARVDYCNSMSIISLCLTSNPAWNLNIILAFVLNAFFFSSLFKNIPRWTIPFLSEGKAKQLQDALSARDTGSEVKVTYKPYSWKLNAVQIT